MVTSRVHSFLFSPVDKIPRSHTLSWLCLSLAVAFLFAMPALQQAFSSEYVVQDDARQHVFWMMRFRDPELFQGNLYADYFQAVAPWGYTTFYRVFATLGLDPMLLNKLLPPALAMVATGFCFGTVLQILPIPLAGFLASFLFNQAWWMKDDIVSGTPVAFVYPILLAFLYFLLKRSLIPCLVAIALQGLFYPQVLFVVCGILLIRLLCWDGRLPRLTRDRWHYKVAIAGLAAAFFVLLPYALRNHGFGPTITGATALSIPTYQEDKWSEFYIPNQFEYYLRYWLCGRRAGMMPQEWCGVEFGALNLLSADLDPTAPPVLLSRVRFGLPQVLFGLLLPILLRFQQRFLLARQVTAQVWVMPQMILVSMGLFLLAHAVLFKLHLPNRYTEHTFRTIAAIAAGIALTLVFDALLRLGSSAAKAVNAAPQASQYSSSPPAPKPLALVLCGLLAAGLLTYPLFLRIKEIPFPINDYVVGKAAPELYQFFAQQPKQIQIASIAPEVNNLPSFSRRSIVVGGKGYAVPYHVGYYNEIVKRSKDLIFAQYSPNLAEVKQFIQAYQVDFWMLERSAFKANYFRRNPFLLEYDWMLGDLPTQIENGRQPALLTIPKRCIAYQDEQFNVLKAQCVVKFAEKRGNG